MNTRKLLDTAQAYLEAGVSVLPAHPEKKYAALLRWKTYQNRLPTRVEIEAWFSNPHKALCLVGGSVSGNLEALDFDMAGEKFSAWRDLVNERAQGLLDRLVVEKTPSGGRHVVYRSNAPVDGSMKLAQRKVCADGPEEVTLCGKKHKPRQDSDGRWHVLPTLIETKGEKGIFLCAPSPGYELIQGDFTAVPTITAAEREILLEAAWSLNEHVPEPEGLHSGPKSKAGNRPGDDFNTRGDARDILLKHGWTLAKPGENEYWRRPGKSEGWSATLKDRVFYVFSTNADPFEPDRAYAPFAVYARLEHDGNFIKAAKALRKEGYGADSQQSNLADHVPTPTQSVAPMSLEELVRQYPALRPPVIEGLLREGETMNLIAASKVGKSWMTLGLALSIAAGRPWFHAFATEPGMVLIVDNELHPNTLAYRIPKVAAAMGIPFEDVARRIHVRCLRGQLKDLRALGEELNAFAPGQYKVVILDAFYRFLLKDTDENSNASMAELYNYVDSYADKLECAFVIVHHSSKGNQSLKSVTDVGAGAGAQSRATDTHLVLRPHEEPDVVVLEAAVRSWPPLKPRCLRWEFPLWLPADGFDPAELKQEKKRRKRAEPEPTVEPNAKPEWTAHSFMQRFVSDAPKVKAAILADANEEGLSDNKAERLISKAEAKGLIHPWKMDGHRRGYATLPQPQTQETSAAESVRDAVHALLKEHPDLTAREVADKCGLSKRHVNRIRRESGEVGHESGTSPKEEFAAFSGGTMSQ